MEQGEIEVLLELGQSYLLNREYDHAIKIFSEALQINPHDPELYYNLGLAYEGAERLADAIIMYEKTLQLDQTFSNAEIRLDKLREQTSKTKDKTESIKTVEQETAAPVKKTKSRKKTPKQKTKAKKVKKTRKKTTKKKK
jgi:tetratricopeptide (TPR) repeat protein